MEPVIRRIRPGPEKRVRFAGDEPRPSTAPSAPQISSRGYRPPPSPQRQAFYPLEHANDSGFFQLPSQGRQAYYPDRNVPREPIYVTRTPSSGQARRPDPIYYEMKPRRQSFSAPPRPRVIHPDYADSNRYSGSRRQAQNDPSGPRRYHTIEIQPSRQKPERKSEAERLKRLNAELEELQVKLEKAKRELAKERYLRDLTEEVWNLRCERDRLKEDERLHHQFVTSRQARAVADSRRPVAIHQESRPSPRAPAAPDAPRIVMVDRPPRESRPRESPPNVSQRIWNKVGELEDRLRRRETARSLRRPV